jgi:hypothetical protein
VVPAFAAGYRLASLFSSVSASGEVFSQSANLAASYGCFEPLKTAVEEPPQLPAACSPAVHCGIGATAHLPDVLGAPVAMELAPHTADTQVHALLSL